MRLDIRTRIATLVIATLTILLTSCGPGADESPDVTSLAEGSGTETVPDVVATAAPEPEFETVLEVEDQDSDGTTVTIARAALEDNRGWVVIHADEGDAPGEILGQVQIPTAGPNDDLTVTLDQPLPPGEVTLWAMIHVDADPEGIYEFPGADVPATRDGAPVTSPFTVTVSR